ATTAAAAISNHRFMSASGRCVRPSTSRYPDKLTGVNTRRHTRASPVRKKRKGDYHHGDLRRALLDATLKLAHELGAAGVTLREAARVAGVSQTAPYRH